MGDRTTNLSTARLNLADGSRKSSSQVVVLNVEWLQVVLLHSESRGNGASELVVVQSDLLQQIEVACSGVVGYDGFEKTSNNN